MERIHVLFGINSDNCNLDLIKKYTQIHYSKLNLHICSMGTKTKEIQDQIGVITTNVGIDAKFFNYSWSINYLIKDIVKNFSKEDLVVLVDGWSAISIRQLIEYEFKNFNIETSFITSDILNDNLRDPINLDSKNTFSSIKSRINGIKNSVLFCPIIICQLKYLIDLEHGLEEELFTEYSRFRLITQLKNSGLIELKSEKSKGLALFRQDNQIQNSELFKQDLEIISNLEKADNHSVFIPSNMNIEWGVVQKLLSINLNSNLPIWNHIKKSPVKRIIDNEKLKETIVDPDIIKVEEVTFKDKLEFSDSLEIEIIDKPNSTINSVINATRLIPNEDALILINSDISDLVSYTSLIKTVFRVCQNVDIYTDDKINPSLELIKSFFVRKIYDRNDFMKAVNFSRYKNIIRTVGCKLPLPDSTTSLDLNKPTNGLNLTYSAIENISALVSTPYCNYKIPHKYILPNTIVFSTSIRKKSISTKIWEKYAPLISRISNEVNLNIILLSLINEYNKIIVNTVPIRKNITNLEHVDHLHAAGILKFANLFVTFSQTDLLWISYGVGVNTLVLDNQDINTPKNSNIYYQDIPDQSQQTFDHISDQIWRLL